MKTYLYTLCCGLIMAAFSLPALRAQLTLPPSGGNQRAEVTQYMGLVRATITYHSPDVTAPNGDDRRGQVWGQLVPWGLAPNTFGTAREMPWRAGANENTVLTVSHDVLVEGKPLPAGSYGLHLIPAETGPWTLILSRDYQAWGSYYYDPAHDALRVPVTPEKAPYHEWLTFSFRDRELDHCTAVLNWEELAIPFSLRVEDLTTHYLAQIRAELSNSPGFMWQNWVTAAQYCLQAQTNLEEALTWAEMAVSGTFVGEANFTTLSTKAAVLNALGREAEGAEVMTAAIAHPTATVLQIHQYGRQLLAQGKTDEAVAVFELNAARHPDTWPVHVGLARGYSAQGQYKKALKHAKLAQQNVPEGDALNAGSVAAMIEKLQRNEDVN